MVNYLLQQRFQFWFHSQNAKPPNYYPNSVENIICLHHIKLGKSVKSNISLQHQLHNNIFNSNKHSISLIQLIDYLRINEAIGFGAASNETFRIYVAS